MLINISINDTSDPPYPPFQTGQSKLFSLPFHLNPQVFVEINYHTPVVSLQLKIGIPYSLLTKLLRFANPMRNGNPHAYCTTT